MTAAARRGSGLRQAMLGATLVLVAGCGWRPGDTAPPDSAAAPSSPHYAPPRPRRAGEAMLPDGRTLRSFYADSEQQLVNAGRMRREVAPTDAAFTDEDLARNFVRIALYDEYVDVNGRFLRAEQPALLRRWERPVRVAVMTGSSESPEESARDRSNVAAFISRLARLTGRDVAMTSGADANFLILFMTDAERAAFARQLPKLYPDFAPAVLMAMRSVENFCVTYSFWDGTVPSTYSAVIVQIPAEHPSFTKLSCVQEEMAQAMGLPNDSADARPSLFNDNKEFALLTEHDAILLRMLYDPRLKPGMTAAEVLPLLPAVAAEARAAEQRDSGLAVAVN
jgi:hypothetical protein